MIQPINLRDYSHVVISLFDGSLHNAAEKVDLKGANGRILVNDEPGRMGEGSCLLWSHFRYYPGIGLGGIWTVMKYGLYLQEREEKEIHNPSTTLFPKESG
jgi:hypothetical protein